MQELKKYVMPNGVYKNTRANSQSIKKKFPEIYEQIKDNYHTKLYMLLHDIKKIPICKNPNCNNNVKLKNIGAGFRTFCSNKCIAKFQKRDKEFKRKISISKIDNANKKLQLKYPNIKIKHSRKDKNYYTIFNYCQHSPFEIYRSVFKNLYPLKCLCVECNKELIKNIIPTKDEIKKFQQSFETFYKKNRFSFKLEWFEINYPKELSILNYWCYNMDVSLSEKIYMFKNNIRKKPLCPICKKRKLIYKSSYEGYSKTCNSIDCIKSVSTKEIEIFDFLKKYVEDIKLKYTFNNRKFDIFIPDQMLLIEYNGLYWHGELVNKNKNYHYNKLKFAQNNNYRLLNIWADDWEFKQNIIKSILLNKIQKTKNKFYARCCKIKELIEVKEFLNKNHLQGWCQSKINIGLFNNNELISLMTFGKRNISKLECEYELLRFCNKLNTNVVGGASKLFSYFLKKYKPRSIVSYANCDISDGHLYKTLKFKEIGHTGINYWWSDNIKKFHRSNFMKHKLIKEGFDSKKTEVEIMHERGFYRIWGTGNLKYEWKK